MNWFGKTSMHVTLASFAILVPWLNPLAPGPSPNVMPYLVSVVASGGLILTLWQHSLASERLEGRLLTQRNCLIALVWALAGVLSSCIGLLQYFNAAAFIEPWVNRATPGEAFGNLRQRNQFASLTNIALAALCFWCRETSSATHTRSAKSYVTVLLFAAVLLGAGNAASASRTGLVQLVILSAVWICWWKPPGQLIRWVLVAAVLSYTLATFTLPFLAGLDPSLHGMVARLREGDLPCSSRLTLWSNVLHLISQKPWLGWGWNELDYAHYITLYEGPRFCEIVDNAHNLPLHLAVELGIPFALLVCGGFAWWVVRQKPWRETDASRQLAWSVIAVILLHSMLEYPLWYGPFQMAFALCIAMLWRRQKGDESNCYALPPASKGPAAQRIWAALAIIMIAMATYAAWDYRRISQIYLPAESRDPAYRDDTLAKLGGSWLFSNQVGFARLLTTPLTRENAQWTLSSATALLHYSPEPKVIEKVIESAAMLGRDDESAFYLARYKAAFPAEYARWAAANATTFTGLQDLN